MHYPKPIRELIAALKALPGVGPKTAERYAFHLLGWSEAQIQELAKRLITVRTALSSCSHCGCLLDQPECLFCDRESDLLCVVASAKDVFSIEATGLHRGLYHVLGGLLSPLDGRGPAHLAIGTLKARLKTLRVTEVILALDSTVEGDATALFLKEELAAPQRRVSRLAHGLPLGSPLEYIDGGTLARAFSGRG
jgi:recombination protein RecR